MRSVYKFTVMLTESKNEVFFIIELTFQCAASVAMQAATTDAAVHPPALVVARQLSMEKCSAMVANIF